MIQTTQQKLKLVKNAHLEKLGDVFAIRHYDTIIFTYNEKTHIATSVQDCSVTSNKQIRFANNFYRPVEIISSKSPAGKWGFSGEIQP